MKNTFIYAGNMVDAGILGYILERSPTYVSSNFLLNEDLLDNPNMDPWDNHADDDDHFSHTLVEYQEDETTDFSDFIKTIELQDTPGVFGLSYGAWKKEIPLDHNNLNLVYIEESTRSFNMWFKMYMERVIPDVKNDIDMHIHDHYQDDPVYKEHMYNTFMVPYVEASKKSPVYFWMLQTCFHHNYDYVVKGTEEEKIAFKSLLMDDVGENRFKRYNTGLDQCYTVDMFDLDIPALCVKLNIEYADSMQTAYQQFKDYVTNVLQV